MVHEIIIALADVDVVDDHTQALDLQHIQLLLGLFQRVLRRLPAPHNQNHPVNRGAHDQSIRNREYRRRVQQDEIQRPLQNLDQIRHPLRSQQLGRVWRNRPRVDQIEIGDPRAFDEIPDLPG